MKRFDGQKILVTGATGFLGSWVVENLIEGGATVFATGRSQRHRETLEKQGARFASIDLSGPQAVQQLSAFASEGLDAIVHCGALSSNWGNYDQFYQANVIATRNLVEVATRQKPSPKFIHISSPSIYVTNVSRNNIRESDPLPTSFANHYAATKYLSELEIQAGVQQGMPAIILRPQALFGPRDTVIFPRIIRVGQKGQFPRLDGINHTVDMTYVENVVESIRCAIAVPRDQARGQAYNITNGEPVVQEEVVQKLFDGLGIKFQFKVLPMKLLWAIAFVLEKFHGTFMPDQEPVLTRYSVAVLGLDRTLNIDLARKELGYEPIVAFDEGLRRTIQWFQQSRA